MNDTRIQQLHEAAYLFQVSGSKVDVCNTVMASAGRMVDSAFRILALARGGRLIPVSAFPDSEITLEHAAFLDEISESVFRSGDALIVDEKQNSEVLCGARAEYKAGLLMPMGDIGILQLYSSHSQSYAREDVISLEILLAHAVESIRRIQLKKKLESQVAHDPLTGVYNRYHLADLLSRESKRSDRFGHGMGLITLDVNRFREVNSRFGQHVGDEVLQTVAAILVREARATDIVVRYGGDEFLLILPQTDSGGDRLIERISASLQQNEMLKRLVDFPIVLATGIAFWSPTLPLTVEETLTQAERAMITEKNRQNPPVDIDETSGDAPLL